MLADGVLHMKPLTILGILALFMLLVLPGAVSAQDLIVTAINPNVGTGASLFANEPNVISITVNNTGSSAAGASTVSVGVAGNVYTAGVGALEPGASQTVTITDTVSHADTSSTVPITATADSGGVITEDNETNNDLSVDLDLFNNGYKGKRWTPDLGGDMETQDTFNGQYDIVYSAGNSTYASAKWTLVTDTWTATDLPIPTGAAVEAARLYQPYSYNKMGTDPAFTASFNGNTVTPDAIYMDQKSYGSFNFPYGLYFYDVTSHFNPARNTLVLTPEGTPGTTNDYALWGAYLVVIYSDSGATNKQIFINDEFDMVCSRASYSVNNTEATVFAPFSGVDTSNLGSAQAIAILASAGDTDKSKFFFNSNEYTGFWADYRSTPQLGFSVYDVTAALQRGDNEARLQSYDTGTNGDNMYAMNTILVVEKINNLGSNIGIFRDGLWVLDYDGNFQWDGPPTDVVAWLGQNGDTVVTGDW